MKENAYLELTISQFHKGIEKGEISAESLVNFYLERIGRFDQKGPCINAIIRVNPQAVQEARNLDEQYQKDGFVGPLHGVPILLKDNVDTEGLETTAGSMSLQGFIPGADAFIVQRLKEAGAIVLAKVNLHEFAIWGETISSILGQTLNPYDLTRTPGGSSGGTGAGVASNFGLVGIGTDTINSVRSPASANNLVGIRPTLGLVSRFGVVPYSYTQDTAGPLSRTVEDAVQLLDVIKGYDPSDIKTAWSLAANAGPLVDHLNPEGLSHKRIGVLNHFFGDLEVHSETNKAVLSALELMKKQGAIILQLEEAFDSEHLVNEVSVHLHDLKDHLNQYLGQLPISAPVHSVQEILVSGRYHPGIKDNLLRANALSTGTADYNERLIESESVKDQLMKLFADYALDAVVYPHQKQLVCKVGASQRERNGVLASVAGFPSICMPAGFSEPSLEAPLGVPIGLEILGRPFSEGILIEIAYGYEMISKQRKLPKSVEI